MLNFLHSPLYFDPALRCSWMFLQAVGFRAATLHPFLCGSYRFCLDTGKHIQLQPCLQWRTRSISMRDPVLTCVTRSGLLNWIVVGAAK